MEQFMYHDIFATKGIEYLLTIVFFAILIPFWLLLKYKENIAQGIKRGIGILTEKVLNIPQGLFYSKNHTWTHIEKSGIAKLGLDDFLVRLTGDVNVQYVKDAGDEVKKGDVIASIQKDGKVLRIYSPISGKIEKTNSMLSENPGIVTNDPYGAGWIFAIEPSNLKNEMNQFFFAKEATEWISKELTRFKDFVAGAFKDSPETMVVLQDGGELRDNTLTDLPGEVWSDFEKEFMSV